MLEFHIYWDIVNDIIFLLSHFMVQAWTNFKPSVFLARRLGYLSLHKYSEKIYINNKLITFSAAQQLKVHKHADS